MNKHFIIIIIINGSQIAMEDSQGISIVKIPLISNRADGKTPTSIQNHYDVTMAPRTKWRGSHHNTWTYKGISTGRHYPWKHSALYLTPDVYKTKTEDRRPKTEDPKPKIQNRRPSCQMPRDKTQKGLGFLFCSLPPSMSDRKAAKEAMRFILNPF